MALNWTMLGPDRKPVPLPNEIPILTITSGAELSLSIPDAPPSGGSTSGGSGGSRKLEEFGILYLTDQRLIFVGAKEGNKLDSLSVLLPSLLSTRFVQPYLGANYLALDIRPTPQGGLHEGTQAEIRLKNQGLFEFVTTLEKTRERAMYMRRQSLEEDENLPAYASPAVPAPSALTAPTRSDGAPEDAPPGYDV